MNRIRQADDRRTSGKREWDAQRGFGSAGFGLMKGPSGEKGELKGD